MSDQAGTSNINSNENENKVSIHSQFVLSLSLVAETQCLPGFLHWLCFTGQNRY